MPAAGSASVGPADGACLTALRTAAAIVGIIGALCLVFVQFLPWGGVEGSGGGFTFRSEAYTWRMESSGSGSFGGFGEFGGSDKVNWYSDEAHDGEDEQDADVLKVRIAIPLLLVGLLLGALGGLLGFLARGPAAGVLLLVGGVLAAAGTVLFAIAVDGLFDSEQDWGASFYLAIAGSALGLVAGVLALAPGGRAA